MICLETDWFVDLDVPRMMDNWVKKMGFPVVTVTETEGGIRVRQDRFLESGPPEPKDNETIWYVLIPYLYTISVMMKLCHVQDDPSVPPDCLRDRTASHQQRDRSRPARNDYSFGYEQAL